MELLPIVKQRGVAPALEKGRATLSVMATLPGMPRMTAAEYLAWEREQPERHEFHDGAVFAMAGGSLRHNALAAAVIRDLGLATRGGQCRMLTSDQRIATAVGQRYVYPDASMVCGAMMLEEGTNDVLTNPSVIVEVLSKSTEAYDRGEKWAGYRRLPSLTDYVLVSQDRVRVEHFRRQDDGSWRYDVAEAGGRVTLASGVLLEVDSIYEGVFEYPGD